MISTKEMPPKAYISFPYSAPQRLNAAMTKPVLTAYVFMPFLGKFNG